MKWPAWVMSIAGSLIVSGIGAVVSMELRNGARAEAAEIRVHVLETSVAKHQETLERIVPLLERIDERISGVNRRLDQLEAKQDERAQRGRK